ncbi:MAG: YHYH domain-containing protein [Clostridiaceae bacterium]|nr:YHYH domain-containing protein [Clostridiaceae bacterium]
MKKSYFTLILSLILLYTFFSYAFAHSGRTDSNGGHYNRSTGEYHYHTGKYAGESQIDNENSGDSEYYGITEKNAELNYFYNCGKREGLKRLYIDSIYRQYYENGFSDALSEFSKTHPVFYLIAQNDKRDILYCDFPLSDTQYKNNQNDAFNNLYNDYQNTSSKNVLMNSFNSGYNYSYLNEDSESVPSYYKLSLESDEVRKSGYKDGYNQFYDGNLYAYKENYPFEALFTTLPLFALIIIPLILIAIVLLIIIILIKKHKIKSINNFKSYSDNTDAKVETISEADEIDSELPSLNNNYQISSEYVSLIPKFEPDCIEEHKHIDFIVGKDISEGVYYFSPKDCYKPAFFRSGANCTNITHNKQRFFLTYGEEIQLVNCYFEQEE